MQQAFLIDISVGLGKWEIESGITLATLAEESCTDPGICMLRHRDDDKAIALPIQKPEISVQEHEMYPIRSWHSGVIHSGFS